MPWAAMSKGHGRAGGASTPACVRLPQSVQMNNFRRCEPRLEIGLRAFERQSGGDRIVMQAATAWASRS